MARRSKHRGDLPAVPRRPLITWKDDVGVTHVLDPSWHVPNALCFHVEWHASRRMLEASVQVDMWHATVNKRNAGPATCLFCIGGPPHR